MWYHVMRGYVCVPACRTWRPQLPWQHARRGWQFSHAPPSHTHTNTAQASAHTVNRPQNPRSRVPLNPPTTSPTPCSQSGGYSSPPRWVPQGVLVPLHRFQEPPTCQDACVCFFVFMCVCLPCA